MDIFASLPLVVQGPAPDLSSVQGRGAPRGRLSRSGQVPLGTPQPQLARVSPPRALGVMWLWMGTTLQDAPVTPHRQASPSWSDMDGTDFWPVSVGSEASSDAGSLPDSAPLAAALLSHFFILSFEPGGAVFFGGIPGDPPAAQPQGGLSSGAEEGVLGDVGESGLCPAPLRTASFWARR